MLSEKKRLANQRNAQKSTGPRSDAGKARSRRNALKHGLAGLGTVLLRKDEQKLAKRVKDWRETLAPINGVEDALVQRAALATVRMERALGQEDSQRRSRVRRTVRRFETRHERQTLKSLVAEPGRTSRALRASQTGASWMIAHWRSLALALRSQGFWKHDQADLALRLLGKDPALPYPDDQNIAALRAAFLGAQPTVDPEEAAAFLGLEFEFQPCTPPPQEQLDAIDARLPAPDVARQTLRSIVADRLKLWRKALATATSSGPELVALKDAVNAAQVGTDTPSLRLQRYEAAEELSLHRSLNGLIKIRKQEPELASIARWEKQGKTYNRRWDGYGWVPNSEWRLPEEVAGGGWRVAGGREGGSTEIEPSTVTGPEGEPRIDSEPQATPRVAGFSALREPGAPQPQLPPGDPDPMAQEPVSATLADAGVGDWGSGVGEERPLTAAGCPMTEQTADSAPVSQPSSAIGHSPSSPQPPTPNPQPLIPNPQPLDHRGAGEAPMPAAVSHQPSVLSPPHPAVRNEPTDSGSSAEAQPVCTPSATSDTAPPTAPCPGPGLGCGQT